MLQLKKYPSRHKTHVTRKGMLYIRKFQGPFRVEVEDNGIIYLRVIANRTASARPYYEYIGRALARELVPDGAASCVLEFAWNEEDYSYELIR